VPLLQQAIGLAPEDGAPRCWLALALMNLGRYPDALRLADEAITRNPDYEWPHRVRALILRGMRKFRPALESAVTAVRLEPEGESALHLLATCQFDVGQIADARVTAERLREVSPAWAGTHNLLANIALKERRWADAEEHCRSALELDPQSHTAMHNLGMALNAQGRKREATECFHQALRIDPGAAESRQALHAIVGRDMAELPIWQRRKRLAEEHETVQTFITTEQERANREAGRALAIGWLMMGWVFTAGWTLFILAFIRQGGLHHHWWEWAAFAAVAGSTLAGTAAYVRRSRQG
jgi:tetratricopeptide (TPR) repeat protein